MLKVWQIDLKQNCPDSSEIAFPKFPGNLLQLGLPMYFGPSVAEAGYFGFVSLGWCDYSRVDGHFFLLSSFRAFYFRLRKASWEKNADFNQISHSRADRQTDKQQARQEGRQN